MRSVVRMLAPAADPSTFRRALVDARDRAAVEQGSFAQENQTPMLLSCSARPPRRAAEWSPDEIDESVDATMVLSDASQRDFGDLVTFLALARTMRLSGGGDGLNLNGDDAGAKLEDILRALEGGTLPPAGGFPDADHLLGARTGRTSTDRTWAVRTLISSRRRRRPRWSCSLSSPRGCF